MLRILGISGSLRQGSHNTSLLRAAAKLLPPGVELEVLDGLRDVPPYDTDTDVEPADAAVARLRDAIGAAHGVLTATPEHNGSIPGVHQECARLGLAAVPQNARRGKPVAVIGVSTGLFGAVWATQAETRKVLGIIGADVIRAAARGGTRGSSRPDLHPVRCTTNGYVVLNTRLRIERPRPIERVRTW